MNKVQILSGNFAVGEGKQGNFSGYDAKGNRVFINKAQMESIGIKTNDDVKPFFAITAEREIDTRDANGDLTGVMVKRLQATAVFKTMEELVNAVNGDAKINIAVAVDLQSVATASGLTQQAVDALITASI